MAMKFGEKPKQRPAAEVEKKFDHNPNRIDVNELRKEADSFVDRESNPIVRAELRVGFTRALEGLQLLENSKRGKTSEKIIEETQQERLKRPLREKQENLDRTLLSPALFTARSDLSKMKKGEKTADSIDLQKSLRNNMASLIFASRDRNYGKVAVSSLGADLIKIEVMGVKPDEMQDTIALQKKIMGQRNDLDTYDPELTPGIMLKFQRSESVIPEMDIERMVFSGNGSVSVYMFIDYDEKKQGVEAAEARRAILIRPSSEISQIADPFERAKAKKLNDASEKLFLQLYVRKLESLENAMKEKGPSEKERPHLVVDESRVSQLLEEINSGKADFSKYSLGDIMDAQKKLLGEFDSIMRDPRGYVAERRESYMKKVI